MRVVHRLLTACLLLAAACAAEGYRCEFVDLPTYVVEGRPFTVKMQYVTPPGQRVSLRCELKSTGHVVLAGARAEVTGEGVQILTLTAPERAAQGKLLLAGWMGEDWRESLCPIVNTPTIEVASEARARRLEAMQAAATTLKAKYIAARTPAGNVGIIGSVATDWPTDLVVDLADRLRGRKLGVSLVQPGEAVTGVLDPAVFDLVVVADARLLPVDALEALGRFATSGGNLMVLGGPPLRRALWPFQGKFLESDAYRLAVAEAVKPELWSDFEQGTGGEWRRATNDTAAASAAKPAEGGALGSKGSLLLDIRNLTGWDSFACPLPPSYTAQRNWTCFWAKADGATSQLLVEVVEEDHSRWMAVVGVTDKWQPFALPPSAFAYWHDSGSSGRGGAGDQLHPEHAALLTLGLAFTHTTSVGGGEHKIWVDDLGSAAPPTDFDPGVLFGQDVPEPVIEPCSPHYKSYQVTNLARLRPSPAQSVIGAAKLPTPKATWSPVARPQGTGLHKARRWRYLALQECLDRDGRVVGTAGALCITGTDPAKGGITATVPVADPGFFRGKAVRGWLSEVAARILDGVFLYEGGAAYYASFGGEAMPVGAVVSNRSRAVQVTGVEASVSEGGKVVWQHSFPVALAPGESKTVEAPWPIAADAKGPFTVRVELRRDGKRIDHLQHEVRIWRPKAQPHWLAAQAGQFVVDGKPWYAHGVNYMPSSGIGIEDGPYFEYWLDPQPYDPDVIERDLDDCRAIGLNMVSVFCYHRSLTSRNLLDLLMRCEDHGLRVNLSLRPGTPMDFQWDQMRELVEQQRLAENDTIFAYDLAWEPYWGNHGARKGFDRDWEAWIVKTYGTIEQAEAAWGVPCPREEGKASNPFDEQLAKDGPQRKMVLDYRRWQNQTLTQRYGHARELMRGIDPHHLVSFRMSSAGDPTAGPSWMGYDFAGLANAVDLLEPEGYGRIGDWERVKPGRFTAAYGRAVAPELPIIWAEFGNTAWNQTARQTDPGRLEAIAKYYDDYYQMTWDGGFNGSVCWWFPGGFRVGENSDYGILNPDRSWRGITRVIHKWAPKLTAPRAIPQPDVWLEFDPDQSLSGLPGIYDALKEQFWAAVAAGKRPGLRRVGAQ